MNTLLEVTTQAGALDIPLPVYIWCFLVGLLGVAFHVTAVKIPGEKARAKAANVQFSYTEWFKTEGISIVSAVITVIVMVVLLDEIVHLKPEVMNVVKIASFFVGFFNSSLLLRIIGKYSAKINEVVDMKTNIADNYSNENNINH